MSLTDVGALLNELEVLRDDVDSRCHPEIPLCLKTGQLAERLQWSIREVAGGIARLRDEGHLIANFGGGYWLAEKSYDMELTLMLYKKRALTALTRLRKMQLATAAAFNDNQRDFFKEAIDEI